MVVLWPKGAGALDLAVVGFLNVFEAVLGMKVAYSILRWEHHCHSSC